VYIAYFVVTGVEETLHCFGGICVGRSGPCAGFCVARGYPRGGGCLAETQLCCCIQDD